MNNTSFDKNLLSLLIRSFNPISSFYTNFLVESKQFTNNEVSNLITPFYFFSSLFVIFFYKKILNNIGIENSSLFISGIYFFNMILFLNIKKRSFLISRMVYFISGFITTFDLFVKFYIGESNNMKKETDSKYSYIGFKKTLVSSFSSMVGQEIIKRTGHYEINIIISIFTQFLGFVVLLTNKKQEFKEIEIGFIETIMKMDNLMICAFLAETVCDFFNLFTRLFFNNILRDRFKSKETDGNSSLDSDGKLSKDSNGKSVDHPNELIDTQSNIEHPNMPVDNHSNEPVDNHSNEPMDNHPNVPVDNHPNVPVDNHPNEPMDTQSNTLSSKNNMIWNIFYLPVTSTAIVLIYIVKLIFPKYSSKESANIKYLNGNANAISNILGQSVAYFITGLSHNQHKETIYITAFILSILSLFIMTKSNNIIIIYLMYLLTETFSKTCNSTTKIFLKNDELGSNLIMYCYTAEIILHVTVNQICKFLKMNVISKSKGYCYVGMGVFLIIILMKLMR